MRKRGQGGIEYILLAGAVIMFVVVVLAVVQTQVFTPSKSQGNQSAQSVWDSINNASNFSAVNFVTACGTISANGNYRLVTDLNPTTTCIIITASNSTFDCDTHLLNFTGAVGGQYGIQITGNNVTLKDCVVAYFFQGVRLETGANNTLQSVTACNNTQYDVWTDTNQSAPSGLTCGINKCYQDAASHGMCVPDLAGASNCTSAC